MEQFDCRTRYWLKMGFFLENVKKGDFFFFFTMKLKDIYKKKEVFVIPYFEVNRIGFKVLTDGGFNSETGVNITRTRLLHSNEYNNVPTHNFNQGNAGITFEVSIILRPEWLYEGKPLSYYLEIWERYQRVVTVVTDAFDIPNGKYTLEIKKRKQTNKKSTIWQVAFYQYYQNNKSFGGVESTFDTAFSSIDRTLINSNGTIDKNSNNDYIRALQTKLIEQGYFTAGTKATGEWSNALTQDITNFQKAQGLTPSGVGDWATISRITTVDKPLPVVDPSNIVFNGVLGL